MIHIAENLRENMKVWAPRGCAPQTKTICQIFPAPSSSVDAREILIPVLHIAKVLRKEINAFWYFRSIQILYDFTLSYPYQQHESNFCLHNRYFSFHVRWVHNSIWTNCNYKTAQGPLLCTMQQQKPTGSKMECNLHAKYKLLQHPWTPETVPKGLRYKTEIWHQTPCHPFI